MPEPTTDQAVETARTGLGPGSAWGVELVPAVCEGCDWRYLLPPGSAAGACPNCFQAPLTALADAGDGRLYNQPPELVLPFAVSSDSLAQAIRQFAGGIWFAPADLTAQHLQGRLQPVYLPLWLVDSQVQAEWQAEAGFDYQVVSHQDSFDQNRNGWVSREVTERRVRWEPRAGRLRRTYPNVAAPALEEHRQLRQQLGPYDLEKAEPFRPAAITGAAVRLPNRPPADAWPEAIPSIRAAAAEECRRACQADHIREFRWSAEYLEQNWSLLLVPLYTTYYLDDDDTFQPLLIHGRTGRLHGPRRASMRRARQTALIIVAAAAVIFVLSLVIAGASLVMPPLLIFGLIGLVIALGVGLLAVTPLVMVWQFNRSAAQKNPTRRQQPSGP